ncbi:MAG: type IV pilin protein [Bacillota bacterium]
MLKSFKKNRKGFTLIELMMVVAVIGILALVLIPKVGGTKDQAKLAGVESNMRIVQSVVEGNIMRYQHKGDSNLSTFAAKIVSGLSDVTNPYTNVSGAVSDSTATTAAIDTNYAVTVNNTDNPGVAANNAANKGSVLVIIDEEQVSSKYSIKEVKIYGYDEKGNVLPVVSVKP